MCVCVCVCVCVTLLATGLSTVTDRPTKSVCTQCHIFHFIVLFVMLTWILLLHSDTGYLASIFIGSICLFKLRIISANMSKRTSRNVC